MVFYRRKNMKNRLTQNESLYLAVNMSNVLTLSFEERLVTDLKKEVYLQLYNDKQKLTEVNWGRTLTFQCR